MRTRTILIALSALALVAAACSSGSESAGRPDATARPEAIAISQDTPEVPAEVPGAQEASPPEDTHEPEPLVDPIASSDFDLNVWLVAVDRLPDHQSGNFRITCERSHYLADDPILFPGNPGASHLHMFFGNTETDADSDYVALRASGGGSCTGGPLNRTAYWVPAMFDGDGELVDPSGITVYYKTQRSVDGRVTEMPPGLKLIAGSPDLNEWNHDAWAWSCRGGSSGNTATIPTDCASDQDVVAHVFFPQCWDGINLDSPNHRSHMAYAPSREACPASHPVRVPRIEYKLTYPADGETQAWRLASDLQEDIDAGLAGATMHADWFMAWEPAIIERWTDACLQREANCSWGNLGDGARMDGRSE